MALVHLLGPAGIREKQRKIHKNDRTCRRDRSKRRDNKQLNEQVVKLSNMVHSLQNSVNKNTHDHYKRSSNSNNNGYDGSVIHNNQHSTSLEGNSQYSTSLEGNSQDRHNRYSNCSNNR